MTKKDFDLVAACIGGALSDSRNSEETILDFARRLNSEFKLDNPQFSTEKFFARIYYWRNIHSPAVETECECGGIIGHAYECSFTRK